jgi:8-oxo-dGTP pyrophosphatase MutT (NUDIX family)
LAYSKERKAFGKEISQHQAIAFKLADMATEIEAARLLVYRAAWLKDQGMDYTSAAAMAKLFASEVAMKEVEEETGIIAEPVQLLGVVDGMRMGFSRFGMYMLLFHLRATGGSLQGHPLETADVGWFGRDELPTPTAGAQWWAEMAFGAVDGSIQPATFDEPRPQMWRGEH